MVGLARFQVESGAIVAQFIKLRHFGGAIQETSAGMGADPTQCGLHLTAVKTAPLNQPKIRWYFPC
jgi:hypothetical protein